jgi:predicted DNA-binding transcriptional regulator AlpA
MTLESKNSKEEIVEMVTVHDLDPMIRKKDVLSFTGFSSAGLDLLIVKGEFPPAYQTGQRAIAWKRSELITWQKSCPMVKRGG